MPNQTFRRVVTRSFLAGVLAGIAAPCCCASAESAPTTAPSSASSAAPQVPITDFGAVADGKTLNTKAIQSAIDHAAGTGGGTVVVPAGTFVSGALFLKPGVGLRVDKGGVLKGSGDIADFPVGPTRIEGHFQPWIPALINADHIDHLLISGEGTLDGSGVPFYDEFHTRIAADRSTKNLDVPRPRLIFVQNCSDGRIEGLHLKDSAFWNVHLYNSHDMVVDGLDISAPARSPSTDGIDIDSCQNITIHACRIANNDDCIALKGSKGPEAMDDKQSPPDEHIHVYDCIFERGGSFVTCGSEATIVRDVVVEHCKSVGNDNRGMAMMRLKLRTDTPQLYEDIHFRDIVLEGRGTLVSIAPWTQYFDLKGHAPPSRAIRNVSVSNITGTFGSFGSIAPGSGDTIEQLTFENIDLTVASATARISGVKDLVIKNVKLNGKEFIGPGQ